MLPRLVPHSKMQVSVVKTVWARAAPKRSPASAAKQSGLTDQGPRLCSADYEIVKVAAHLEST